MDDFLAAALEPEQWLVALDHLAEATGSLRGQLIGIGGPTSVPFNWVTNLPDRATEDFIAIGGGSPAINYRVAADRLGDRAAIKYERHYERACPDLQSNIYLDFCRDYDLPYGCQASILHRDGMLVGLALLRSERDGPTTVENRRLFASLVPHVKAAVCMQVALESQGAMVIAGAMEAMALPAFVLDGLGRVCASTAGAEAVLTGGDWVKLIDRELRGLSLADDAVIGEAIASIASGSGDSRSSVLIRSRRQPLDRALLTVVRLPTRPMNFGFVPHALAILRVPGRMRAADRNLLRLAYNLTQAEAEVAVELAAGRSRVEIAAARGVAAETIKAQLKSLFVKTGVAREAELIVKLVQLGL